MRFWDLLLLATQKMTPPPSTFRCTRKTPPPPALINRGAKWKHMGANISNIICSKRVYLEGEASYRLSANLANCDKGSPSIKGGNIGWLSNSACNRPKPDVFHKWGDDMRRINTWTISSQLKKKD